MAIISSYPIVETVSPDDLLVMTEVGAAGKPTKNVKISSIVGTVPNQQAVQNVKVSLSPNQIRLLGSTPQVLVPSPGTGKYIRLISVDWNFTPGDVVFDASTFNIQFTDTSTDPSTTDVVANSPFVTQSAVSVFKNSQANTYNLITDTSLDIGLNTNLLNGNGSLIVYVSYQIITL